MGNPIVEKHTKYCMIIQGGVGIWLSLEDGEMVFQRAFFNVRFRWSIKYPTGWRSGGQFKVRQMPSGIHLLNINQLQLMWSLLVVTGIKVNVLSEWKQSSWWWFLTRNHIQSSCLHFTQVSSVEPPELTSHPVEEFWAFTDTMHSSYS